GRARRSPWRSGSPPPRTARPGRRDAPARAAARSAPAPVPRACSRHRIPGIAPATSGWRRRRRCRRKSFFPALPFPAARHVFAAHCATVSRADHDRPLRRPRGGFSGRKTANPISLALLGIFYTARRSRRARQGMLRRPSGPSVRACCSAFGGRAAAAASFWVRELSLDKERTIRRDRLVAASLVGILLVLLYGPGAAWFVQADRVLYDQLATRVANAPLENGMIVTIDPDRVAPGKLDAVYGAIIQKLKLAGRSEEHTSELQSRENLVCRLLLEKKKQQEQ